MVDMSVKNYDPGESKAVIFGVADHDDPNDPEIYERGLGQYGSEVFDVVDSDVAPSELEEIDVPAATNVENIVAYGNPDLITIVPKYREFVGPEGSPGVVATHKDSDIESPEDLIGADVAVEDFETGTAMAMLTSWRGLGHDYDDFGRLFEQDEEKNADQIEEGNLDAGIVDTQDFHARDSLVPAFDYNQVFNNVYGMSSPPTQLIVTTSDQYRENPETFDELYQDLRSVHNQVNQNMEELVERQEDETGMDVETLRRKAELHSRFGPVSTMDMNAMDRVDQTWKELKQELE